MELIFSGLNSLLNTSADLEMEEYMILASDLFGTSVPIGPIPSIES